LTTTMLLRSAFERNGVQEVVLATNPNMTGDGWQRGVTATTSVAAARETLASGLPSAGMRPRKMRTGE